MTRKEIERRIQYTPMEKRTPQFYLNILCNHFLGENWYSYYWNQEDINMDMIFDIVRCNPKRFINFINKVEKLMDEEKPILIFCIYYKIKKFINKRIDKLKRIIKIIKE